MSLLQLDGSAFYAGLDSPRYDPLAPAGPLPDTPFWDKEQAAVYHYAQKIIYRLMHYRRRYWDNPWRILKKAFAGDQYPGSDVPGWRARVIENYIYRIIEEGVAMMTENNPSFTLRPPDQQQAQYTDTLQAVVNEIFRRQRIKVKAPDFGKSMLLFGNGYFKTFWDPSLEEGLGDVAIEHANTFFVWKDEFHAYMDDCNYVMQREEISLEDAVEQFPEIAGRLRAVVGFLRSRREGWRGGGYSGLQGPSFASPTQYNIPDQDVPWTAADADIGDMGESVMKTELWIRDPSTDAIEDVLIPRYNHGTRLIQLIGPFPIYWGGTPYEFAGFPFSEAKDISIPNEPYAVSTAYQLWSMQKSINKHNSNISDWGTYFSNPIWIGDDMAMQDWAQLTTAPGLIVRKRHGMELRREAPPNMPASFFQAVDRAIRDLKDVGGIGIDTAKRGQARSAMAMEAVHEAASYIVKLKLRQMESAFEDVGRKLIKLIQQYYTTNRIIRITREAGKVDFVEFNGGWLRGDWGIEIEPYSTLPVSKAVLNAQGMELFRAGAIDDENLLETINWRGREAVLRRKAESAKAMKEFEFQKLELGGKMRAERGGKMKGKRPAPPLGF